ncbi:MAG: hypothetical protein JKY37_16570, partial [Nannocystaceae bacterium]|nr:hypothetical protein [Nannocystaceae bacterium]
SGCGGPAVSCRDDDDCGREGRCEGSGWCSFPDASCPSGRRFAELSGDGVGGACVDATAAASSDATSGSETSSTSATAASGSSPATVGVSADSTSTDSVGSTSAATDTASSASTTCPDGQCSTTSVSESSSEDSSDTAEPPCPGFFDDFEDGLIDPAWTGYGGSAHMMEEVNGELRWHFATGVVEQRGLQRELEAPISTLRVHATETTALQGIEAQTVVLFRDVGNPPDLFLVWGNGTVQFRTNSNTIAESVVHEWVEARFVGDEVVVAVSSNGVDFQDIATVSVDYDGVGQNIWIYGQTWTEAPAEASGAFGSIEVCTP